ncbi:hypothetical protein BDY24DRAFT_16763 [Mrakia frigida]|uniref:uncharacterized protein n=1 Tax=Mrakia frigida TaxID=29902 RepID=UPI003FCC247C
MSTSASNSTMTSNGSIRVPRKMTSVEMERELFWHPSMLDEGAEKLEAMEEEWGVERSAKGKEREERERPVGIGLGIGGAKRLGSGSSLVRKSASEGVGLRERYQEVERTSSLYGVSFRLVFVRRVPISFLADFSRLCFLVHLVHSQLSLRLHPQPNSSLPPLQRSLLRRWILLPFVLEGLVRRRIVFVASSFGDQALGRRPRTRRRRNGSLATRMDEQERKSPSPLPELLVRLLGRIRLRIVLRKRSRRDLASFTFLAVVLAQLQRNVRSQQSSADVLTFVPPSWIGSSTSSPGGHDSTTSRFDIGQRYPRWERSNLSFPFPLAATSAASSGSQTSRAHTPSETTQEEGGRTLLEQPSSSRYHRWITFEEGSRGRTRSRTFFLRRRRPTKVEDEISSHERKRERERRRRRERFSHPARRLPPPIYPHALQQPHPTSNSIRRTFLRSRRSSFHSSSIPFPSLAFVGKDVRPSVPSTNLLHRYFDYVLPFEIQRIHLLPSSQPQPQRQLHHLRLGNGRRSSTIPRHLPRRVVRSNRLHLHPQ